MPPAAVIRPVTEPRNTGRPRPVSEPSSESASAKAIEMPAPTEAARPTRKASQLFLVAKAAAKTGARMETEPSMRPASPGWTICNTNRALGVFFFLLDGGSYLFLQGFRRGVVTALDIGEIAEQLADVDVGDMLDGAIVEAAGLQFDDFDLLAYLRDAQRARQP